MVAAELVPQEAIGRASLLWLIPALPLLGAAIDLFVGRRLGRWAGWLATALVAASFLIAVGVVTQLLDRPDEERLVVQHLFDWISLGNFHVGLDLRLDAVSATMILVVTGVGSLIHLYSIGYMRDDPRFGRYFAYLNLFVFFMLMLVLGANYLVLYLGWEGVGACSYLLIGFWFEEVANTEAAKKAFITTRIGDSLLLIGLATIVFKFGTLDYGEVFTGAPAVLTGSAATVIALLLLAGAIGKSAQLPLHVWLPDAMAGPTPVSALIHAATMVTAGVYLVIRSVPIFELSPVALDVVAWVGILTVLFGGICALAQWDIKRVLAYSTISQLGFMFLAVGLGAYAPALFFLVAHAFYKALLFLGAGSVIHGMEGEQDLRRMGGLGRRMPWTAFTMGIGALALAGFPFLAGFFAKDIVLEIANTNERWGFYVFGSVGALLSALYVSRLWFLTFVGRPRSEAAEHAHESESLMVVPLAVLGVGAAIGGVLSLGPHGWISRFVEPLVGLVPEGEEGIPGPAFLVIAVGITFAGLLVAWWVYASGRVDWHRLRERLEPLPRAALHGWYVDRAYDAVIVQPAKALAGITAYVVDARGIDGLVNAVGGGTRRLARSGRLLQTGFVRSYALVVFLGAVAVLLYVGTRL